jgi:hypothetical protein
MVYNTSDWILLGFREDQSVQTWAIFWPLFDESSAFFIFSGIPNVGGRNYFRIGQHTNPHHFGRLPERESESAW